MRAVLLLSLLTVKGASALVAMTGDDVHFGLASTPVVSSIAVRVDGVLQPARIRAYSVSPVSFRFFPLSISEIDVECDVASP